MRPRRRLLLLVAVAAVAGAVIAGTLLTSGKEEGIPGPNRPTIVQDDPLLLFRPPRVVDRTLGRLRALGADWVRLNAGWSLIAPKPSSPRRPSFDAADPGAYPPGAWEPLDRAVRLARDHGLQVMIDIAFWAPRWAVARPFGPAGRQRYGIDPREYARFAQAVARRYSGKFAQLPQAVAFAIWNEPNYAVFWMPQWVRAGRRFAVASAHDYRELVYAAHPAIRRAAPDSLVLIGNTSPTGPARPDSVADSVAPLRFLREMACVDGRYRPVRTGGCRRFRPLPGDGWAHHPYSQSTPPERSDRFADNVPIGDLGRLTGALARLAREGRTARTLPVWITEYGYETNPPDPLQKVGLYAQARWIGEAERIAFANPAVRSYAQFLLRDLGEQPGSTARRRWSDYQSGLELPDGTPKPALQAFAHTLVVRRARDGRALLLWGHLRAGSGERRFRVSARRPDGTWRPLPAFAEGRRTDADGYFALTQTVDPGALFPVDPRDTFRLELLERGRWRAAGLPLIGAG